MTLPSARREPFRRLIRCLFQIRCTPSRSESTVMPLRLDAEDHWREERRIPEIVTVPTDLVPRVARDMRATIRRDRRGDDAGVSGLPGLEQALDQRRALDPVLDDIRRAVLSRKEIQEVAALGEREVPGFEHGMVVGANRVGGSRSDGFDGVRFAHGSLSCPVPSLAPGPISTLCSVLNTSTRSDGSDRSLKSPWSW